MNEPVMTVTEILSSSAVEGTFKKYLYTYKPRQWLKYQTFFFGGWGEG